MNDKFKKLADKVHHEYHLKAIRKLQHKYVHDAYWVDCGRYDGHWAYVCKVCGLAKDRTAYHK